MKTFTATLAYDLSAYKTVEVEAQSCREAIEKIRAAIEDPTQSLWDIPTLSLVTAREYRIPDIIDEAGEWHKDIPLHPKHNEFQILDADKLATLLDKLGITDTPDETITTEEMAVTIRNGLEILASMEGAEISEDFSNLFVTLPDGQKFFIKVERINE